MIEVYRGEVRAVDKIRGERTVNKALLNRVKQFGIAPEYGFSFAHADAPERMASLMQAFEPIIQGASVHTCALGAVIGTHTGPGVVCCAFVEKE